MKRKTNEEYDIELAAKASDYTRLENYQTNKTPVLHRHKCGFKWRVRPAHLLNGSGCPLCAGNFKSHDLYVEQVKDRFNVLEKYVNTTTKILHHNLNCDHKYLVSPDSILHGNGCPICNTSRFKLDKPALTYYVK